jgi:hypothetical protein
MREEGQVSNEEKVSENESSNAFQCRNPLNHFVQNCPSAVQPDLCLLNKQKIMHLRPHTPFITSNDRIVGDIILTQKKVRLSNSRHPRQRIPHPASMIDFENNKNVNKSKKRARVRGERRER